MLSLWCTQDGATDQHLSQNHNHPQGQKFIPVVDDAR